MTKNTISCPSCKTEIELTEVVAHQARQQMSAEMEARRKTMDAEFGRREMALNERSSTLEKERRGLDERVREKLQLERVRLAAEARKQAQSDLALQMTDLQEQLKAKENKLAEAQKAQIDFLKKERALADKEKELELDLNRRLNAEREKIQNQAREFVLADHHLKLADKDKLIEGCAPKSRH